jgi:paraquat-inducible protein B
MAAPTNHWKLGLFVVVGVVAALATVVVLSAASLNPSVEHYVSYFDESVQGLDVGSPIKFRGVTIGKVGQIEVAPDHRHVEVQSDLAVTELARLGLDVAPGPVLFGAHKKLQMAPDLRVQLDSAGLTGIKFLQLDFFDQDRSPPPSLPFPVPANYIPATASTMKDIEDSLVRAAHRLPEVVEQMSVLLTQAQGILGDVNDKHLPAQVLETLQRTNHILVAAESKLDQVDTGKLSKEADKTLHGLTETVGRMNEILGRIGSTDGLLASVVRSSDAFGDTVRSTDGLGNQLEDALRAVQDAAKSIHQLADAVGQDPDMLLKGRARTAARNR